MTALSSRARRRSIFRKRNRRSSRPSAGSSAGSTEPSSRSATRSGISISVSVSPESFVRLCFLFYPMPASRKGFPPSSSPPPDHALPAQGRDLLVPVPEFRKDLLVVLPKPRGPPGRLLRQIGPAFARSPELERPARLPVPSAKGGFHLDHHPPRPCLGMGKGFGKGENRGNADVLPREEGHPLVPRLAEEDLGKLRLRPRPFFPRRVLEAGQVLSPDRLQEIVPEPGFQGPDAHVPAAGAPVRLVAREHPGEHHAAPPRRGHPGEDRRRVDREHRQRPVGHGYVHKAPLARGLPRKKRHQDPGQGHHRSTEEVSDLDGRNRRRRPLPPARAQHAGVRDVVDVMPRDASHRTGLPVPRNGAVHHARVHRGKRFVLHPETLRHAGAEPFDHDVGMLREGAEDRFPLLRLEVERQAFFPAVQIPVRGALSPLLPREGVAHPRRRFVHFDDIGAVIGHHQRAERAGKLKRQVEDPDTGKRRHRRIPPEFLCYRISRMEQGGSIVLDRAIFLSDAHLSQDDLHTRNFLNLVEKAAAEDIPLFLLGDIFDLWFGAPGLTFRFQEPVIERLRELRRGGLRLYYVEGNRDFYLKKAHEGTTFHAVSEGEMSAVVGSRSVYLSHGDTVNRTNRRFKESFPEKESREFALRMFASGVDFVILGHFNTERILRFAQGRATGILVVLPSWKEQWRYFLLDAEGE